MTNRFLSPTAAAASVADTSKASVCGMVLHDWSPFSQCCVNCGRSIVGAPVECEPTTAEREE